MMQLSTLFPGLGVGKGKYKSSWQCQNDDINNHPVTENGHCLASFQGRECVQALKCVPGGRNLTFLLGCFSFLSLTVFIGEKDEFLFPNKFPSNLNHCQFWGLTPELNKQTPTCYVTHLHRLPSTRVYPYNIEENWTFDWNWNWGKLELYFRLLFLSFSYIQRCLTQQV